MTTSGKALRTVIVLAAAAGIALAAWTFAARSAPLAVSAATDRSRILIGDTVRYTLTASARGDVSVEQPDLDAYFAAFTVRDKKRSVTESFGRRVYRYTYFFTKEDPGAYSAEPLAVRYKVRSEKEWREASVPGFTLTVQGLLSVAVPRKATITIGGGMAGGRKYTPRSDGPDAGPGGRAEEVDTVFNYDIKDGPGPKTIMSAQDIVFMALIAVAAVIGGLALIFILYDRFFRPRVPPPPIDAAALEKLKGLEERFAKEGSVKEACSLLSAALVGYLRARFAMEPLEKTSREFLAELEGVQGVNASQRERVRAILTACDMVRYAAVAVPPAELTAAVIAARQVIDETKEAHDV